MGAGPAFVLGEVACAQDALHRVERWLVDERLVAAPGYSTPFQVMTPM
jgi:hypothetical protein